MTLSPTCRGSKSWLASLALTSMRRTKLTLLTARVDAGAATVNFDFCALILFWLALSRTATSTKYSPGAKLKGVLYRKWLFFRAASLSEEILIGSSFSILFTTVPLLSFISAKYERCASNWLGSFSLGTKVTLAKGTSIASTEIGCCFRSRKCIIAEWKAKSCGGWAELMAFNRGTSKGLRNAAVPCTPGGKAKYPERDWTCKSVAVVFTLMV